ncbi:DUF397 domain-containing protein [Sphaerimonospora sp. CA-214678]|uniref:DUF397 domain-containing protein n=1 Tax=Sphaerimonospora sp. CA-214678 TaxID=3240029 RepID=UPI003D8C1699
MNKIENWPSSATLAGSAWRKSRHSNPNGNCVELTVLPNERVAMRNSRHPAGPVLIYGISDIAGFIRSVKEGEFDDFLR